MVLCSACLLGIKCRWDAKVKPNQRIVDLAKKEILIPVCPEQLGGLPTPRIPQEIQGCSGEKVLNSRGQVKNKKGKDVTKEFIIGARETLKIAKLLGIKEFIGKSKSPSCGYGKTYDGSFTGKLINGNGITVALLNRNGIKIISEENV
ncbi:DUF523 domain-containing protein [Patescibacteria group bacterium]|nr:DUF523 domain-containing protein [Patescibacteria group bacterium]